MATDHTEGTNKEQHAPDIKPATAEKIDRKLDELGVAKSKSGKDQRDQPDHEGSASSSKDTRQE